MAGLRTENLMPEPVQSMSSIMLIQEFREICMKLAEDRTNTALVRRSEDLAYEIERRMSWG
jgi:hypothetical protein